jgi:hypothetical protein
MIFCYCNKFANISRASHFFSNLLHDIQRQPDERFCVQIRGNEAKWTTHWHTESRVRVGSLLRGRLAHKRGSERGQGNISAAAHRIQCAMEDKQMRIVSSAKTPAKLATIIWLRLWHGSRCEEKITRGARHYITDHDNNIILIP